MMDKLLETQDTELDEDFYKLLGCDETSSGEQISTEFKLLAKKYHPDKVSCEEDRAEAERVFIKLERAKETLLDKDKRSKYDHWRTGGFKKIISFEKWLEMQSRVHMSMHWAMPQRSTPALPEGEHKELGSESHDIKDQKGQDEEEVSVTCRDQDVSSSLTSLEDFRKGSHGGSHLRRFRNYDI